MRYRYFNVYETSTGTVFNTGVSWNDRSEADFAAKERHGLIGHTKRIGVVRQRVAA